MRASFAVLVVVVVIGSTACGFHFDRDSQLKPGDIAGRAIRVDENGKPAPAAQVISLGDGVGRRTSSDGHFVIRGLPTGTFSLRFLDDGNHDGWPERTGAAAAILAADAADNHVGFVDLGDVKLAGSMTIAGKVFVDGQPPIAAGRLVRVFAVRDACFDVDAAHPAAATDTACAAASPAHFILGAEAETGADSTGAFRFEQVGAGSVAIVAAMYELTSTGALGVLRAISDPIAIAGHAGDVVELPAPVAFVEDPPALATRQVQINVIPGLAEGDVVALSPAGSGAATCDAAEQITPHVSTTITTSGANTSVVLAVPLGPWDVLVCHGLATGALTDQVAVPSSNNDVLVWGPVVVLDNGLCATVGNNTDCNGDGVPGLPPFVAQDPVSLALWTTCLAQCTSASSTCTDETTGTTFDCDDDGDGQPDPQEPACYGPGRGTDLDGDGLCSPVDPFPQCKANDPVLCVAGTNDTGGGAAVANPTTRTVSGADIDTFVTSSSSGTIERPVDLSQQVVEAIVASDGSVIAGTGSSAGLFTIEDVPVGPYTLHVGSQFLDEDAQSSFELGTPQIGRPDVATFTQSTPLTIPLEGMSPWQSGDQIEMFAPNANVWAFQIDQLAIPALKAGDTAPTITLDAKKDETNLGSSGVIDGSKGDLLTVAHLAGADSSTGVHYLAMTDVVTLPAFTQVDGQALTTPAAQFTAGAALSEQVTVAIDAPGFEAAAADFGPNAAFQQTSFSVLGEPGGFGEIGATADPLTLLLPPGSALVDAGTMGYAVPLIGNWSEIVDVRASSLFFVTVPGIPGQVFFFSLTSFTDTVANVDSTTIEPRLSPLTQAKIDGADFFAGEGNAPTTPTLTWQAPAVGTPDSVEVTVIHLFADPNNNGKLTKETLATQTVDGGALTATIEPGVLVAGERYLIGLAAKTKTDDVTGSFAQIFSGLVTVGADACAGQTLAPLTGDLAIGAGFSAIEDGIEDQFVEATVLVDDGTGTFDGVAIDPFFFGPPVIARLGTWPFALAPQRSFDLIPPDETATNVFPLPAFAATSTSLVACYGTDTGAGRVLLYSSSTLSDEETTQGAAGCAFVDNLPVVLAFGLGTLSGAPALYLRDERATPAVDKVLVTLPSSSQIGPNNNSNPTPLAVTSDGALAILFSDNTTDHVIAIDPTSIANALASDTTIDGSVLADVDSGPAGTVRGVWSWRDGIAVARFDANGNALAIDRVPLPVVGGVLTPGAAVPAVTAVDACTALAIDPDTTSLAIASIGTDVLAAVERGASRRWVRIRAP